MSDSIAILTSYFSKKKHPNSPQDNYVVGRNADGCVSNNEINYIKPWYELADKLKLNGFVFHDNLSDEFVEQYTTDKIKFIRVEDSQYSNLDYRWICYEKFLEDNFYDYIFLTDCSDVSIVQNPLNLFLEFQEIDYFVCNDSIKLNQFPYLEFHQKCNLENLVWFMINHEHLELINMGVIGADYQNIKLFLNSYNTEREKIGRPEFGHADMFLGQYIFRSILSNKSIMIGEPVCSEFKKFQNDRKDVYFIHK